MQRQFPRLAWRLLGLTLLFSASAVYEAGHVSALSTGDVWWHLRTGLWILQNHAVPHAGLFSQYPDLPWNDSSWGYEALLAAAYRLLGLRAIPLLLMGLKVALAIIAFRLARAGHGDFWPAVVLSAVAQYVMPGLQPLPSAFSILFLAVELQLLLRSRRSGEIRSLLWLPALFVLWANLHIQVVSGLLLLGLFLATVCVEHVLRSFGVTWLSDRILPLPVAQVGAVAGLSFLGTFLNPYSFRLFSVACKALYSDVSFQFFTEMEAMSFRRLQEFALMLLVMTAFLALGRRRSLELFELVALIAGTVVAFRIQRDGWMAVLPAIAILGEGFHLGGGEAPSASPAGPRWEKPLAALLVAAVVAVAALHLPDENTLMTAIGRNFPVKACDFIRENHLPQPLFNAYAWGGFLTWYLPEYPVAVDGRVELYGDEILTRYFKVVGGKERMEVDPALADARTLLLEQHSGMAKALTTLPALSSQYRLHYSDNLAAVFVRQ